MTDGQQISAAAAAAAAVALEDGFADAALGEMKRQHIFLTDVGQKTRGVNMVCLQHVLSTGAGGLLHALQILKGVTMCGPHLQSKETER